MLVSYTASKVLTNANSQLGVPFSTGVQDRFNRNAEKSIGANDYPHNLVMSYSYELPVGPGKRWLNSGGGWREDRGRLEGEWHSAIPERIADACHNQPALSWH